MARRALTATYRLQLTSQFTLADARARIPYLHELGVSHLYLSPVLAARAGSTHGYDVIDHARLNPELGTDDDLWALASDLHARDMGIVLDIVPNHMAASAENRYWDDVLQHGRSSRYADWFDIDWEAPGAEGKVVLPVLGQELSSALEQREITLHIRDSGARVAHQSATFPLAGATLPKEIQLAQFDPAGRPAAEEWAAGDAGRERMQRLLEAQHYRLAPWRDAEGINYRRFFEVNDLVALRMESEALFAEVHWLILRWVRDGVVDGLRVDHVDGLRAPAWYLSRLRRAADEVRHADAPDPFPIFVEKILLGDEVLPSDWPVTGTTGYDFMSDVEDLFLDPAGFDAIEANYRGLRRNPALAFRAIAREGKRRALNGPLRPDVLRVARAARAYGATSTVDALAQAVVEVIAEMEVYRTYLTEPGEGSDADRNVLSAAFRAARSVEGVDADAMAVLESAFFAAPSSGDHTRAELVARFQQLSGPAAAKGVEDTALYVHVPLVSRNEVGGTPDRDVTHAAARLHARNAARATDWPHTLLATNTHDTKRSADVRARLDMLTTAPKEWARYVSRWRKLNKPHKQTVHGHVTPDTNSEYLYYQTLLGIWPAARAGRRVDDVPDAEWREGARDRLVPYMVKAVREAKVRTSWTETDTEYERGLDSFVRATLQPSADAPFLPDVARLLALIADGAERLSLARVLIHLLSPGTPDLYQGDEVWNFALVDPDNRRPVSFDRLGGRLEETRTAGLLRDAMGGEGALSEDRVKLALVSRLLHFRRSHRALVSTGEYLPLLMDLPGVFGFARRNASDVCIAMARTRPPGSSDEDVAHVPIPNELAGLWHSVLTGRGIELVRVGPQLTVAASDLVPSSQPCELLFRDRG